MNSDYSKPGGYSPVPLEDAVPDIPQDTEKFSAVSTFLERLIPIE